MKIDKLKEGTREHIFLSLVRSSLWGAHQDYCGRLLTHGQFQDMMQLAQEQALVGLMSQGLMDSGVLLERADALNMYAQQQSIRQRNAAMDEAVVALCKALTERGIKMFVFKGQAIGAYYPDPGLRQSGDIDFFVYPEDWGRAVAYFRNERGIVISDLHSSKDVSFAIEGIVYEMHNRITLFSYPPHSCYWERVVMKEIMATPYMVTVAGQQIPTLAPTYNALFIFVHIFQHLIADGIGLRQFCDWAVLLSQLGDMVDVSLLERHLEGIGLKKAYHGLGAILTCYLGLPEAQFPMPITKEDRERLAALWENMLERGNFGHNVTYKYRNMLAHGLEHLWRMTKQSREFYYYAPAEAWWHVPNLVMWWPKKIWRMMAKMIFRNTTAT